MKMVIIGAGASGLTAAISAAKNGNEVTVLELKDIPGKKIYATGNGKCNITNDRMDVSCYNSDDKLFVERLISKYQTRDIIEFFEDLGIALKNEEGYYYPRSKQASTIVEVLVNECERLGVSFIYNCNVKDIRKEDETFVVRANIQKDKNQEKIEIYADKVAIACGGKSSPKLGSDGTGYYLAGKLGHTINEVVPSLVPLCCDDSVNGKYLKMLHGVRCDAYVMEYDIDNKIDEYCSVKYGQSGEIQMTDYGVSGIVVFQMSGRINRKLLRGEKAYINIDFFPEEEVETLCEKIDRLLVKFDLFTSLRYLINSKLAEVICDIVANKYHNVYSGLDVAKEIKNFKLEVVGSKGFDFSQVSSGGVSVCELHDTMESKLVKGLFLIGEVLDVDGICGGYNLHFAFASGIEAGKNA